MMHGTTSLKSSFFYCKNLSRCTFTWTSNTFPTLVSYKTFKILYAFIWFHKFLFNIAGYADVFNLHEGFAKLRKASPRVSLCPSAWDNSTPTGRVRNKFCISEFYFFENTLPKFSFRWSLSWTTDNLQEDLCALMAISRWIPLRMKNVWNKICGENLNTYFVCPLSTCAQVETATYRRDDTRGCVM